MHDAVIFDLNKQGEPAQRDRSIGAAP